MSLTSFVGNKDVRERFKQEFPSPKFSVQKPLLAPPLTKHYFLVGTAFDYLLRFYLKRLNPQAVETRWVAENAVTVLFMYKDGFAIHGDTGEAEVVAEPTPDKADAAIFQKINAILSEAKKAYQLYLKTGEIIKPLLTSAMLLANLDIIYRTGRLKDYVELDTVSDEDIKDLTNLIQIVTPKLFKAKKVCVLNPTFGEASKLVGGADADLIIDDTLIDIKTTKKLELPRKYFDQLIGYYCLYRIGGIDGLPQDCEIKNLAVYFSRHAYLHLIPVKDCIGQVNFQKFLKWFKERARK
ncbi:MAG TPA: hypothetical protein ENH62_11635 [Marinobacter sp.]|uniref:PD-(D/E)XK endonuclease-like domain-containing protein n=1 Tax=marine sediment metagenome TaxID=412755 RepID=A0A0F9M3L3_9ZZZZ|nr:hypothetical protein [Marinobacter sp.]HEG44029.1 hypothetical protein [Phycisphaerales bacterium]